MANIHIQPKEKKFPQHIWLPARVFLKVLETANKLGVAPNVVCAEMIAKYLEGGAPIVEKVVDRYVDRKVMVCPACLEEFSGIKHFVKHVRADQSHFEKWLQGEVTIAAE